jgi:hypothetical protein
VHASKWYVDTGAGYAVVSNQDPSPLGGDLSGSGTTVTLSTLNPVVSGSDLDATEGSLACATIDATTLNAYISTGYTNGANLIANPQIANVVANLSIKYECRVVYVVGPKTYTAAKEIATILT